MNINDLADRLEQFYSGTHIQKAAEMLRKQADEITALHQILGYEGIGVSQEYLDECVAELRKAQKK
jgi:hypothetical protein